MSYSSNLTTITIPESITEIGNSAFYACDKLSTIYYGGTAEQWEQITIAYGNDVLASATIIFSSK